MCQVVTGSSSRASTLSNILSAEEWSEVVGSTSIPLILQRRRGIGLAAGYELLGKRDLGPMPYMAFVNPPSDRALLSVTNFLMPDASPCDLGF